MAVHKRWANVEYWQAIKRRAPAYTGQKYLQGMDMFKNERFEESYNFVKFEVCNVSNFLFKLFALLLNF